jgi:RHS repeat-associated protein
MTIGNYHYDASSFISDCTPHFVHFAYKFTGKERDAESGLDYFGARYYASSMGRWMSPDWADKPEAVPYSSLDNPQSLNLYGYVLNNPLSHADKDGSLHHVATMQTAFIYDSPSLA